MIRELHHTSFTVRNLQRGVEFWTRVLGFQAHPPTRRDGQWVERGVGVPGASILTVHLRGYGHGIEFMQFAPTLGDPYDLQPNMCGASHVCLVVDDIEGMRDRILDGGGQAQGEVVTIAEEPRKGWKVVYLRDPNGIVIELMQAAD